MENYVFPVKILNSNGDIKNINNLFIKKELQIGLNEPVNTIMNEDSNILLDFGKELCGGIRILVCNYDNRPIDLLVRFGESVSEALSDIGNKNSSNDHAVREFNVKTTNLCDLKVLIDIPYEIRKERTLKRDYITEEAFDLREKASIIYDKNDFDYILNNNDNENIRKLVKVYG